VDREAARVTIDWSLRYQTWPFSKGYETSDDSLPCDRQLDFPFSEYKSDATDSATLVQMPDSGFAVCLSRAGMADLSKGALVRDGHMHAAHPGRAGAEHGEMH